MYQINYFFNTKTFQLSFDKDYAETRLKFVAKLEVEHEPLFVAKLVVEHEPLFVAKLEVEQIYHCCKVLSTI